MCGGMLQGIFLLSPVDNNRGNISQLVQVSPPIRSLSVTYYRYLSAERDRCIV